ncbi:SAC3 family protein C isoform X1 [Oryza glaberrima]|uniref:SAC3 family protein C isoform X1 n=1 Tax=Oryza glaberrima TaxID=4538 RepID=UPI00224BF351|nr:SAC3 family protein C isoform X1 [Oryza glaberrima]
MDRRDMASHRGRSSTRGHGWGRGWRGRGEGRGLGRSRGAGPSPPPPPSSSTSSFPAAASATAAGTGGDAPPIVGSCPDMCPARERAQRERLRDLAVFERVGGDPARTSPSLAVKKFCRTISSTSVQASDIRPLPVLRETMDYLLHLLDSSEHQFEIVHDFIFDRTRSVRQDLSIQNIVNAQAIQIYEDVIKFHILSHQKLSRSSQDSDASSLCYLNMEQLMKCLLSLFDMYDVIHKNNSQSSKETEYYSFYVLLHLGCKIPKMVDSLSLWYGHLSASIIQSKEMVFARSILRFYHLGNFKRFFCAIAAEGTDLQLRLLEPFLNEARVRALMYFNHSGYKLQHHPLTHLSEILMIEELDLETLCRLCGLEINNNEDTKAFAPKQASFCVPASIPQINGIYISRENQR